MKTSYLLTVGALLAPAFASVLANKPQMKEYKNMNDCKNNKHPIQQSYPQQGRCYDMDDDQSHAFYCPGGEYEPQMYSQRGCKGRHEYPKTKKDQCCKKGEYRSYRIGGYNNRRDEEEEEEIMMEARGEKGEGEGGWNKNPRTSEEEEKKKKKKKEEDKKKKEDERKKKEDDKKKEDEKKKKEDEKKKHPREGKEEDK